MSSLNNNNVKNVNVRKNVTLQDERVQTTIRLGQVAESKKQAMHLIGYLIELGFNPFTNFGQGVSDEDVQAMVDVKVQEIASKVELVVTRYKNKIEELEERVEQLTMQNVNKDVILSDLQKQLDAEKAQNAGMVKTLFEANEKAKQLTPIVTAPIVKQTATPKKTKNSKMMDDLESMLADDSSFQKKTTKKDKEEIDVDGDKKPKPNKSWADAMDEEDILNGRTNISLAVPKVGGMEDGAAPQPSVKSVSTPKVKTIVKPLENGSALTDSNLLARRNVGNNMIKALQENATLGLQSPVSISPFKSIEERARFGEYLFKNGYSSAKCNGPHSENCACAINVAGHLAKLATFERK